MTTIRINDVESSYICKYDHLHDYSKIDFKELEKDKVKKTYNNVEDLMKDLEED